MRSIADQDKIKQVWEDKIATGDVRLVPRIPEVKKSHTIQDLSDFKSEVETESIADLASTKLHWEKKAEESEDIKGPVKSRASIGTSLRSIPASKSWDAGRGAGYRDTNVVRDTNIYTNSEHAESVPSYSKPPVPENESAIDREIRLAREREEEIKHRFDGLHHSEGREKGSWEQDEYHGSMPIGKVPAPVSTCRVVEVVPKKSVQPVHSPPPTVHSVTSTMHPVTSSTPQGSRVVIPELRGDIESSTDVSSVKSPHNESRIEREIREQQEREQAVRGAHHSVHLNKVSIRYFS